MSGNGSVQGRLLLAVSRVGHRHPLLAALRLHGRDVKHKVRVLNALVENRQFSFPLFLVSANFEFPLIFVLMKMLKRIHIILNNDPI
jgi:hypothetical protein